MRFGRRPPVYTRHGFRAGLALASALAPLGSPPQMSDDYVTPLMRACNNQLGMALNDNLGDCVCADSAHQVMLHTANAGSIVIPTDDEVLAMYEAVGHYVPGDPSTDQGCIEAEACQYLVTTGLAAQKSDAHAPIDPANLDHIRWAIQLFGCCRLGVLVDSKMLQQFESGQAWTQPADPSDPNGGGHDPLAMAYDATYVYVGTWGKVQAIAWPLMANPNFLEEAHGEVWGDWMRAGGLAPTGFDLATTLADLQQIAMPAAA